MSIFLAFVIISSRKYYLEHASPLILKDGIPCVNELYFDDNIRQLNQRFDQTLSHMIVVFGDPERICPGKLPLREGLVGPIDDYDPGIYDVTIYLPKETSIEMVNGIKELYLLTEEQVVLYDLTSPLSFYGNIGVTKMFYSYGQGLLWSQIYDNPKDPIAEKINRSIMESQKRI